MSSRLRTLTQMAVTALVLAGSLAAAPAGAAGWSAGISVQPDAGPGQMGLPAYPGAQPWREPGEDSAAVDLKLWGGDLGLRVVALKYSSRDSLPRIRDFYREALARLGPVLDCSDPAAARRARTADGLDCRDDHPASGEVLLKAGSAARQTVVSIQPGPADTVRFDLVQIETRGFSR